jgi:hypothetical protein
MRLVDGFLKQRLILCTFPGFVQRMAGSCGGFLKQLEPFSFSSFIFFSV